jgi:hypothetical protein
MSGTLEVVKHAFDYLETKRNALNIETDEWLAVNDAMDILFDAEESLGAYQPVSFADAFEPLELRD